ncbi:MAG: hypothetical protein ACOY3D_04090 [Candidatus Omnitrophota bacterium]
MKKLAFVFLLLSFLCGCIYYYKHDKILMGTTSLKWVEKGMNKEQVISIAGEPSKKYFKSHGREVWHYGSVTLTFQDNKLEKIEEFGAVLMD